MGAPELDGFASWLSTMRGLSDSTVRGYCSIVRDLHRALRPSAELTSRAVERYILERGGSPQTVIRRLAAIKAYCRYLHIPDVTSDIDRPRVPRGIPQPVKNLDKLVAGLPKAYRDPIVFLAETGLRISEAYSVDVESVVPRELVIHGKGGRDRVVPLSKKARQALSRMGGRMSVSRDCLQRMLRVHGTHAHALRHTAATRWIERGGDLGDVQALLGHASPATTVRYARFSLERLRRVVE